MTQAITLPKPRLARFLVLAGVFVCAACGLVYELALVALGSYLIGDAVTQASITLGVMVFAMGVGSLLAKPLVRWPVAALAAVEGTLAVVGGLSVMGMYAAYAWWGIERPALVVFAFLVGMLIGMEIPLLMRLMQWIREQDASEAVADLFAADYVGALVGGLAFPFLILPTFGLIKGAIVTGIVNAVVGIAIVGVLFRHTLRRTTRSLLVGGLVVSGSILGAGAAYATTFEADAREMFYRDPIAFSQRSAYQEIVLTHARDGDDTRLYLNGDLQFSSLDEYRYHEALVHPAMTGRHERVLILGGGDGLGLREVLKYREVRQVTLVDLDPAVVALARTNDRVRRLNEGSLDDPRVEVVQTDAFQWVQDFAETGRQPYDVVIVDFPDPDDVGTAKLYSAEMFGMVTATIAPEGRMSVQSGSPWFVPDAYWCVEATLREAGWRTTPYQVDVPTFGNWGFHLATRTSAPPLRLAPDAPTRRFLTPEVLAASAAFPPDRARRPVEVSTLVRPTIIGYQQDGWIGY